MPGVLEAHFSYPEGSGVVTFDPSLTRPETFLAVLEENTGFQGRIVKTEESDHHPEQEEK